MNRYMRAFLAAVLVLLAAACSAPLAEAEPARIKIIIGGDVLTAVLRDNAAVRDLISLLPLTLEFKDFAEAEKIAYPPRKLMVRGTNAGMTPAAGDIAIYAPWGNIAVFYKDGGWSDSLIPLGTLDSGIEILRGISGGLTATIELAE